MRVLDRSEWGAAPAKRSTPHPITSKGRPVDTVVVHHSVTPAGPFAERLRSIQQHHLHHPTVPFVDIAYNAAISNLEPVAARLRGPTVQGGATRGQNETTLSICAIGDFDGDGKDNPTPTLIANLDGLLRLWIAQGYVAPRFKLRPHSDFSATACCGRRLSPLLQGIANGVMTAPTPRPVDRFAEIETAAVESAKSAARVLALIREARR